MTLQMLLINNEYSMYTCLGGGVLFLFLCCFCFLLGRGGVGGGGGKKNSIPKKYNYPVVYFGLS